ncbi:MAG: class I SAM-dependent methyltransferase [Thiothrix sp.]|nr:MAG: class I SAM-dependent methyltransferase [Thiothrix sp.]
MQIAQPSVSKTTTELELISQHLNLVDASVLELGCGKAQLTRALAQDFPIQKIIATEVDTLQHEANLASEYPSKLEFRAGGAQSIALPDNSVDVVFMFKSLHHVPVDLMPLAFQEIARVLKPQGSLWISEPIYAGAFNEVLRLFHDEQHVREAAFQQTKAAVDSGLLQLKQQIFFNAVTHFVDFAEFEQRIIGVTHTKHVLSPELYVQVKTAFNQHLQIDGAHFSSPQRVDWLQKAA